MIIGLIFLIDAKHIKMIRVLFWNIMDQYNKEKIDFLNNSGQYDIIILAEAQNALIDTAITGFSLVQPVQIKGIKWIKAFKRNANNSFSLTRITALFRNRIAVVTLTIPGKKNIDLYCVHLHSKVNADDKTQLLVNTKASNEIFESIRSRHNRVILLGDFNHNPFEAFMNSRITLNSIPNKKLVNHLKQRSHDYLRKVTFYNPMWNHLGDFDFATRTEKYNGTYFFEERRHSFVEHIHWNMFDQVLVSQPICDCLDVGSIKITTNYIDLNTGAAYSLADDSFLTKSTFLNSAYSDHLPLTFLIDETKLT